MSDSSSKNLPYSSGSSNELRFKSETIKSVLHFALSSVIGAGLFGIGDNVVGGFVATGAFVTGAFDGVSVGIVAYTTSPIIAAIAALSQNCTRYSSPLDSGISPSTLMSSKTSFIVFGRSSNAEFISETSLDTLTTKKAYSLEDNASFCGLESDIRNASVHAFSSTLTPKIYASPEYICWQNDSISFRSSTVDKVLMPRMFSCGEASFCRSV